MDLISREAALDCFHDWIDRHGDVHTPDEMAEYRAIEELPFVESEQRWIPCSERLPEDVEEGQEYPTVIYSTNSGEVAAGWYETLTRTWWRESASDDVIKDKVIAWMPLPTPYTERRDE